MTNPAHRHGHKPHNARTHATVHRRTHTPQVSGERERGEFRVREGKGAEGRKGGDRLEPNNETVWWTLHQQPVTFSSVWKTGPGGMSNSGNWILLGLSKLVSSLARDQSTWLSTLPSHTKQKGWGMRAAKQPSATTLVRHTLTWQAGAGTEQWHILHARAQTTSVTVKRVFDWDLRNVIMQRPQTQTAENPRNSSGCGRTWTLGAAFQTHNTKLVTSTFQLSAVHLTCKPDASTLSASTRLLKQPRFSSAPLFSPTQNVVSLFYLAVHFTFSVDYRNRIGFQNTQT